MYLQQ